MSSIKILSRAPNDDFTCSLFKSLLRSTNFDYEAYYIWSNPPHLLKGFLNNLIPTKPNVVLGIKDLLDMWVDFNWWHDSIQVGPKLIVDLANRYPETNFIIFTSLENLHHEIKNISNIQIIPWGGDFTNQSNIYPNITPVLDKNFNSSRPFISLNRHAREHRLVLLSYLFGFGYQDYGDISFLNQTPTSYAKDDLLELLPWEFDLEKHSSSREEIINGYKQIYNNDALKTDDYDIYSAGVNNNFDNFVNKLSSRYAHTFTEIITESSFSSPAFMITEKFLNSVYGCNFPILLSGAGAVAHLREVGFDMFDDIIDHSYDSMPDPFDRIINAVERNKKC